MQDNYDIKTIMEEIEQDLIASMRRTLWSHKKDEEAKGFNWPQWQALKIKQFEEYKNTNREIFNEKTKGMNKYLYKHIKQQFKEGASRTNKEAIKSGFINKEDSQLGGSFFGLNHRKLDALIKSTKEDMSDVKYATLRMANDQYRQIIYKAQVYANTGAGTVKQAIDMATRDFLARGFNCIEYKDGSRHNIADYCDMAIRTANKRANLMGEGEMRKKLGNPLVYISKHGGACDKCTPWEGRVYIDDVWSGGKAEDGEYPLLSTAIAGGLFHPRCQHGSSTYYEGINEEPEEVAQAKHNHNEEDKYTQYLQQRQKQYERLANGSLDPENIKNYQNKAQELQRQIESPYIELPINIDYTQKPKVKEQQYYIDTDGTKYKIDNKNVKIKANQKEREVASLLSQLYGQPVYLVPVVLNPQGIKTPDYMVNKEKFDLKEILGNGKNTLDTAISKKKRQSSNFIFDISNSKITENTAVEQIKKIYNSKNRLWVDKIILTKDGKILKIFKRK